MEAGAPGSAVGGSHRPGIHLFVPMLHRRDAVGEHTRVLRDQLLAAGIPSRIYIDMPDPETADETRQPYQPSRIDRPLVLLPEMRDSDRR